MSSALDWNPFRNRLSRHISGRFAVVFGRLGIHTGADLFQPLCWWHRCVSLAFVHRELLVLTQSVCHYDDPMMRLHIQQLSIEWLKTDRIETLFWCAWIYPREIVRARKHLRLAPRWSLLYSGELFDFAKQPNREPSPCERESPPRRRKKKREEETRAQTPSWLENTIWVE